MGHQCTIVCPVDKSQTNQCTATPPWFVQKSEYNVLKGRFKLLRNGEEAFGALDELLEDKAREGVQVRVLCWAMEIDLYGISSPQHESINKLAAEMDLPKPLELKINPANLSEANTPGRRFIHNLAFIPEAKQGLALRRTKAL